MYQKILIYIKIIASFLGISVNQYIDDNFYVASYENKYKKGIIKIFKNAYQLDSHFLEKYGDKQDQFSMIIDETSELPPIDMCLFDNQTKDVIGFASFEMDQSRSHAHIYMICIDHAYRRQGLGRKFLLHMLEYFKKSGMKTVSLKAHYVANSAAIKLYESVEFKKLGKSDNSELIEFKKIL